MERTDAQFFLSRAIAASLLAGALLAPSPASADTISGTVSFQGNVIFVTPIAGITLDDMVVSSLPGTEPDGSGGGGEHCDITSAGSAGVDALGAYPETGTLTLGIEVSHGGNVVPTGGCIIQLQANGNDGANVSAHGTVTVAVSNSDIMTSATVTADDIPVRQSKTQAGLSKDCLKYVKKQIKFRGKCNYALWKLGATDGALKCKSEIEPADCDPSNYAEAVLALSFGDMDQQVDPPSALAIDTDLLADESKCQRYIGKAAVNFFAKRNLLVQKSCVALAGSDDDACREQATRDANTKLSLIDNCFNPTEQAVDVSGLTVPDIDDPCRSACVTAGVIDRKCLKDCFENELSTLSDGLVGDVPACGNGVVQSGETCDDGNVANGDCCSSICGNEAAGSQMCGVGACQVNVAQCSNGAPVTCTPGTPGVEAGNCADTIDNDCDGLTDLADTDNCP